MEGNRQPTVWRDKGRGIAVGMAQDKDWGFRRGCVSEDIEDDQVCVF